MGSLYQASVLVWHRFPLGLKRLAPTNEDAVVVVCGKPDISQCVGVVRPTVCPKCDESNAIAGIKLKDIATVVKAFITIRCPINPMIMDQIFKILPRQSKIVILLNFAVDGTSIGIRNCGSIGISEGRGMLAPPRDTPPDFVKRNRKCRSVVLINAVSKATDMNHEQTKCEQPLFFVGDFNSGFDRESNRITNYHL
ncbi:MAG: hypothetical protein JWP89_3649 [Schlesneria sp.]|nr:hypothetical protein [Schlesneria sp.]